MLGSASATLVGLMFVAASVGAGVFTMEKQGGLRSFLSPTVVAFSVVLATSLMTMLPFAGWQLPGAILVGIGLLGMLYSWRVWYRIVLEAIAGKVDLEDRIWYFAIPGLAYCTLALAGIVLRFAPGPGCDVMAAGICLLLLAGIRNAWDMTTWVVMRRPH